MAENQPGNSTSSPSPTSHSTGELILLDPESIRLWREEESLPRMQISDRICYARVRVVLAFPLSDPDRFVSFIDWNEREIGMVEHLDQLEPETRRIVREELRRRYFTPIITRVKRVRWLIGSINFEVETDRGPRSFDIRGRRSNIVAIGPRRYLLTDMDGNRYEIPDVDKLDPSSYSRIEGLI